MKEPGQRPERSLLWRLVFDNYPLKLLALALAIALFSIVHSDQDAQRSMYIDVVALLPPRSADKLLVSTLPAQVKVTLRGSRSRINALQHDDFSPIQMDLREPGRRFYQFDASAIDVSGPVRVVAIEPSSVELIWRTRADRKVSVHVKLRGVPEEGFTVHKPVSVTPSTVIVSGPKEEVDSVVEVFTEDVPVDGLGEGAHERRVQLEPLTGHLEYVNHDTVAVHLTVVAAEGERTFRRLDVAVLGADDVTLRPASVGVTLRGPARALSEIDAEQIVPYVDLSPTPPPTNVEVVEVKVRGIPDSCSLVRVSPGSVIVRRGR